jgi:hypothetical protein
MRGETAPEEGQKRDRPEGAATLDAMGRVKVLFIAGLGRSGTTLLANLLGQIDGYLSLGEMRHIWDRGILENRRCGCGAAFRDCPLWRRILDRACGGFDERLARRMIAARDGSLRTRHLALLASPVAPRIAQPAPESTEVLRRLYASIRAETACRVIVDSSKSPADAYRLGLISDVDLHTVHVVRDPRAVAYSWSSRSKKTYDAGGDEVMERFDPIRISLLWDWWNVLLPRIWARDGKPYIRVDYESFAAAPREVIQRIMRFAGEEAQFLPFVGERRARMSVCHTVSGNPNRFSTGVIGIEPDEEWRGRMALFPRLLVSALTAPWRSRFGY